MGILGVIKDAIGSSMKDQYLEIFVVDSLGQTTMIKKGYPKNTNNHNMGSDDVISNGSKIMIPEGTAAVIVQNGAIAEVVNKAGMFTWNGSKQKSVFSGGSAKDIAGEAIERTKFASEVTCTQGVYFVNMLEIRDGRFKNELSIPYFDPEYRNVYLDLSIVFSFKVCEPEIFFRNVSGNVSSLSVASIINGQYAMEVGDIATEVVNSYSGKKVSFSDLMSHKTEFDKEIKDKVNERWRQNRGLELHMMTIQTNIDMSSALRIEQVDQAKIFAKDPNALASHAVLGTTSAMNKAAANTSGAVSGFAGMAMAASNNISAKCPFCNYVFINGIPESRRCDACGSLIE